MWLTALVLVTSLCAKHHHSHHHHHHGNHSHGYRNRWSGGGFGYMNVGFGFGYPFGINYADGPSFSDPYYYPRGYYVGPYAAYAGPVITYGW